MALLLLVAFVSGFVTILAPCIWPLLPIVLSTSAYGSKSKSFGITVGITSSFGFFTLALSYLVTALHLDPNILRILAVAIITILGLALIFPKISLYLEAAVSTLSSRFGKSANNKSKSFLGGLLTGLALGIVWTPCAGPILATIATLAATQTVNLQIILVTVLYCLGIAIPLFLFSYWGNILFSKTKALNKYTGKIQQIFGIVMILTALAIFTNFDKIIETKLLNLLPSYSNLLNKFELSTGIDNQLNSIKGNKNQTPTVQNNQDLQILGKAPDFAGITNWLNSNPLTIGRLKGKVVLVDFWTYTCINCIRTLPYVTSWYEKYKDQGFVVIGVHTPEFEFEKNTQNVQNALKLYKINYPVAQDNNYRTWDAYQNNYWPAKYLIDKNGIIRYEHFGEGDYDKTEMAIKSLLTETGSQADNSLVNITDETPTARLTPETYLGTDRMERLDSFTQPGSSNFTLSQNIPQNYFSLGGSWNLQSQYAQSQASSILELNFYASKVFLVITPKSTSDQIKVFIDGKPADATNSGEDVKNSILNASMPKLYNIIDLKSSPQNHLLRLEFQTEGTQVFAFTFG